MRPLSLCQEIGYKKIQNMCINHPFGVAMHRPEESRLEESVPAPNECWTDDNEQTPSPPPLREISVALMPLGCLESKTIRCVSNDLFVSFQNVLSGY